MFFVLYSFVTKEMAAGYVVQYLSDKGVCVNRAKTVTDFINGLRAGMSMEDPGNAFDVFHGIPSFDVLLKGCPEEVTALGVTEEEVEVWRERASKDKPNFLRRVREHYIKEMRRYISLLQDKDADPDDRHDCLEGVVEYLTGDGMYFFPWDLSLEEFFNTLGLKREEFEGWLKEFEMDFELIEDEPS